MDVLWSDPRADPGIEPNFKRGAGARFDRRLRNSGASGGLFSFWNKKNRLSLSLLLQTNKQKTGSSGLSPLVSGGGARALGRKVFKKGKRCILRKDTVAS